MSWKELPTVPTHMPRDSIARGRLGMFVELNPEQRMSYVLNLMKEHIEQGKQLYEVATALVPAYKEWKAQQPKEEQQGTKWADLDYRSTINNIEKNERNNDG